MYTCIRPRKVSLKQTRPINRINLMRLLPDVSLVLLLASLVATTTNTVGVRAWLPTQRYHPVSRLGPTSTSTTFLSAEAEDAKDASVPDFTGKSIYQRTFYRLSPGSNVAKPNALVVEERVRFRPDPDNSNYILPWGPATLILREGTEYDEITKELYRFDGATTHTGPGAMETTIATILFLASNPQIIQGNVLQLGCESGLGGLLGCIGAKFTSGEEAVASESESSEAVDEEVLTVPDNKDSLLPSRLHHLTLSDEDQEQLNAALDNVRRTRIPGSNLSIKEVKWSVRSPVPRGGQRMIPPSYRTIVGSDIDFSYPSAKELARTVANSLLPSNPLARANTESSSTTGSSGGFGGLGMMEVEESSAPTDDSPGAAIDTSIPPAFVHVAPDDRENLPYLRQFLEKGFRMTVDLEFLKLQRLRFVYQVMPEETPEEDVEDLDLELQEESASPYQCLMAVHHPDYAGDGTGEYFFPLETGEYEGGSRSTYLEPEEGNAGSPW